MTYQTEQETFWAGAFGDQYIERNTGDTLLALNLAFFAQALRRAQPMSSVIEFGANVGMNLRALKMLHPDQQQFGIEINERAASELATVIPPTHVIQQSILDFAPQRTWDLVLIKTVLIHIAPTFLPQVYDALYYSARRYILVAEYYNPSPDEVSYRGHTKRLFRRDFAGELLARHSRLKLVDYGFVYRHDPIMPQDDITWFLLQKTDVEAS